PSMVAVVALLFLVSNLINMTAIAVYAGPEWTAFVRGAIAGGDIETLTPLMASLMPRMLPAGFLCLPVSLITFTLFVTAVWRGVLAPQEGGIGYLRFGMAELRQLMVLLLIWVFMILAEVVLIIVMSIVSALVGTVSPQAEALVFMIIGCGVLALLVMVAVHLSMAGPASFERRRVQVLSAWPIANQHFWPMLSTFLVASMLSMVVMVLGMTISRAPLVLLGGGLEALAKQSANYTLSLAALFSPLSLVAAVMGAIFQAMQMLILVSPVADLYRQVTAGSPDRT
ncbi:MAG: hypothetical protein JWM33_3065, partial [Caulobacteraceae bacterium]|nr:hypothetical protein [Caulobacteraceae bacterium]